MITAEEARAKSAEKNKQRAEKEIKLIEEGIHSTLDDPDDYREYCLMDPEVLPKVLPEVVKKLESLGYTVYDGDDEEAIKISWESDEILEDTCLDE